MTHKESHFVFGHYALFAGVEVFSPLRRRLRIDTRPRRKESNKEGKGLTRGRGGGGFLDSGDVPGKAGPAATTTQQRHKITPQKKRHRTTPPSRRAVPQNLLRPRRAKRVKRHDKKRRRRKCQKVSDYVMGLPPSLTASAKEALTLTNLPFCTAFLSAPRRRCLSGSRLMHGEVNRREIVQGRR